jgi:hypothetical protein
MVLVGGLPKTAMTYFFSIAFSRVGLVVDAILVGELFGYSHYYILIYYKNLLPSNKTLLRVPSNNKYGIYGKIDTMAIMLSAPADSMASWLCR